jgi:Cd2+/Zn2+-exporting ATPase
MRDAVGTRAAKAQVFKIQGMDCVDEVVALKRELSPLVGGEAQLLFDVLAGKMSVLAGPHEVAPEAIMKAVAAIGMRALPWREDAPGDGAGQSLWDRHGRSAATLVSGLFASAGFAVHAISAGGVEAALGSEGMGLAHGVPVTARLCYLIGILAGAWFVLPRAWIAAARLRPDMNLLMAIAVAGAVGIGEWFEAATVAFLFALSLALESWSVERARRAVGALLDLAPPSARVRRDDGREEAVPPATVAVGTVVIVKPGEKVPLDGRVLSGTSHLDQAPITGESQPVPKQAGDTVYAGTINGEGALEIETTKAASETTLALIVRMVGEAQGRRARAEQWVEKFARVYTPAVLGLAVLVLLIAPLLLGGAWADWIYRSLVLLVIGCPCALVISTPVSIVAALAAAAHHGVLIKGGVYVELPAGLRAIALDKTGTLTHGRPTVVQVVPLSGHDERGLLEIVAALEARSEHPLAAAILAHARERGVTPAPAEGFRGIPGKGAAARIAGQEFWLGSHRYLEERGQETPEVHEQLEELSRAGRTVVVVGDETHVCGLVALADGVRPASRDAVAALHRLGVERIVMLTGDNQGTAEAVAAETGVDEVLAELLPADKVTAIERLVASHGQVAMVGDGVNDAPALARASLGIAMGAAGSGAAIETADIALMADDLAKLPWLIEHSRRTLRVVRQNIAFALAVKAVFVVLTLAGHASLWAAIAADMGASLLVIANGLRLLRS